MHGDEVGALDELVDGDQFDAELRCARCGQVGVVRDDRGLERSETLREELADAAESDDTDGLAEDLDTVELASLPGVLTQSLVCCGNLASGRHEERDSVLGSGVNVGGRCVDDHHAALGGCGDLDVVQADTGAADDLQLGAGSQNLGVDGGGGTDENRVGLGYRGEQRRAVGSVDPTHLHTVTERLDCGRRELVGDQNNGTARLAHVQTP